MTDGTRRRDSIERHDGTLGGDGITFDPTVEYLSDQIREATLSLTGLSPDELPNLDNVVDTDALDALFAPRADGTRRLAGSVLSFRYADAEVCVHSAGVITVTEFGRAQPR